MGHSKSLAEKKHLLWTDAGNFPNRYGFDLLSMFYNWYTTTHRTFRSSNIFHVLVFDKLNYYSDNTPNRLEVIVTNLIDTITPLTNLGLFHSCNVHILKPTCSFWYDRKKYIHRCITINSLKDHLIRMTVRKRFQEDMGTNRVKSQAEGKPSYHWTKYFTNWNSQNGFREMAGKRSLCPFWSHNQRHYYTLSIKTTWFAGESRTEFADFNHIYTKALHSLIG